MEFCIPHFGSTNLLRRTLASIFATCPAARIYIADDTHHLQLSPLRLPAGMVERVTIIAGTNRGYAAQANILLRLTRGSWVVVMNNDVVLNPNWWPVQQRFIRSQPPSVALIASQLLLPSGLIDSAGDSFTALGIGIKRARHLPRDQRPTLPLTSVSGALLLVRQATWQTVGGFDEQIGSYFEDVDFGLRVLRLGYKLRYNHQAVATHWESSTVNLVRKTGLTVRNSVLVVRKNFAQPLRSRLLRRLRWWWFGYALFHPQSLRAIHQAIHGALILPLSGRSRRWRTLPGRHGDSPFLVELALLRQNYRFTSYFW